MRRALLPKGWGARLLALLPFLFLLALADPPPPPQGQIDQGVRDFLTGILNAMLNLNDWIALFKASLRDFQAGAYTIGRSLIVVGLIWSLIRAVYYGSLEEVLGAMARVVLAGGFLWFGEVLDESFGGTQGVYYAVTNTFRTELADAMTEAANNLKALGAVINPLFTIVAIVEAGVVHLVGTGLNDGTNMPDWAQQILAGIGAAAQLLNPASLLLVPFVIIAMVLTVLISTMFMLASAFWPIVAGSLALPIGLGPQLFGRWLSVVVWAFIMGAVGPFVVRGGMELGVSRPAAYIVSQAKEIVDTTVEQLTGQFRENRRIFAETLQNLAVQNGWDPRVCGFEVFADTDGKLNYRNVPPDGKALLSPVACGTMTKEAIAQGMRQMGTFVLGIGKGLVDMFQAWAQTLLMTVGGMAAALLIAGYLSSLVATFFGGLSLAVTAAAVSYATGMATQAVGRAMGGAASALEGMGQAAGSLGRGLGGPSRALPSGAGGGGFSSAASGGGQEVPPAYQRTVEVQAPGTGVPYMHRAEYGQGVEPAVVRPAPGVGQSVGYTGPGEVPSYKGAPEAPGRWTDRAKEVRPPETPSGTTLPAGGPPPGRWIDRSAYRKGGDEE
ncbi:hypothetical protein TTHNP3_00076 (plasmid) [Thermus thermophilus]|uniref:TrbL/VirB6 plasmid conjugal transfer protein n=1 Tax=Thermus thermophilus TaxID=274 RepID=A0A3P4AX27_THETH|nr:hypothetical protein [Thermus thermophilus]VCU54563.1 hypothetical protein TTHNP3_00076 [Thermus thermophilus]